MNHDLKSSDTLSKIEKSTLKYLRAFIEKVPQIIVQSRCGEKKNAFIKPSPTEVYEIGVENNPDIQVKTNQVYETLDFLKPFSLCIEISLKTADGDTLVLETWCLKRELSEKYFQQNHRVFADSETVFGHFMLLLKSTITITRIFPAFKLSMRQSADTHVMMYRLYVGDPQVDKLGTGFQEKEIGEVYTPIGTVSMEVKYRSKFEMIIAPQKADKENFLVKSDYFNVDMSPKKPLAGIQLGRKLKSPSSNSNLCQKVGAFASYNNFPDAAFPELEFLEKPFLNMSRINVREKKTVADNFVATDSNLNYINETNTKEECSDKDFERLSCSDGSDSSDFVLVDVKPPFANYNSDSDLEAFLQSSPPPPLSSLTSQKSLKDQVTEVANQIEMFETSMSEFDNFVDTICKIDIKK